MNVLVAFEQSGAVRQAFRLQGHNAWSCDILPARDGSKFHIQCDVREILYHPDWDMMIAFPPCTYDAVSGARWFKDPDRQIKQKKSIMLFRQLLSVPIPKKCIEHPVSIISTAIRKPDQIIQPWQFGTGEVKQICLWLDNLPLLKPTEIVDGRDKRIWNTPPSPDRQFLRSSWSYYPGICHAMANQWGNSTLDSQGVNGVVKKEE